MKIGTPQDFVQNLARSLAESRSELISLGICNVREGKNFSKRLSESFYKIREELGTHIEKTVAQAERARFLSEAKKSEAERERSDLAGVGHSVFSRYVFRALVKAVVKRRYFSF